MIARLGVMQGRLVPPEDHRIQCFPARRWRDEFPRVAEVGLGAIEWIYERFGAKVNPIADGAAWAEVRALADRWHVDVPSLCADILMDEPVLGVSPPAADAAAARVEWLMERAAASGILCLVLPFVGGNALRESAEVETVLPWIVRWAGRAEQLGLELHLETALDPAAMATLLSSLPSRTVWATYDIGNSLQFGFDAPEELGAYGERIGSVHVKDAMRGGQTVPLGTGEADFVGCFRALRERGYRGRFVVQAARIAGEDGRVTVQRYVSFVRGQLTAAGWETADGPWVEW